MKPCDCKDNNDISNLCKDGTWFIENGRLWTKTVLDKEGAHWVCRRVGYDCW